MNAFGKFVKSKWFPWVVVAVILIILGFSWNKIDNLQRQASIKDQNIEALTDTITIEKQKSGALLASRNAFIATNKELSLLSKTLSDKVKEQDGKIITLGNTVINLKIENEELRKYRDNSVPANADPVEQTNDSTFIVPWTLRFEYDSINFDVFSGKTEVYLSNTDMKLSLEHKDSWMESRETQIELTFGQKLEDNKLRVFVESKYPGLSVKSLEGVLIDPNTNPLFKDLVKPKKWFHGLEVGLQLTAGYDLFTFKPALVVGAGLGWNIYKFK